MDERGILAARDRPEERVAERLAFDRRGAVCRNEEAGRPVIVLDRVVEERQIHHRHALDPEDRVLQERIVVEVERRITRDHLPAWRGLHARAERAVHDPVFLGSELVDLAAAKEGIGLLRAEHAAIDAVAERRHAVRRVEDARPRLCVELDPLSRDEARRRSDLDVAGGDDAVAVGIDLGKIREELGVVAVHLDRYRALAGQHEHSFDAAGDVLRHDVLRLAGHFRHATAGDLALWRLGARSRDTRRGQQAEGAENDEADGEQDTAIHARGWSRQHVSRPVALRLERAGNQRRIPRSGPMRKIEPAATTLLAS